MMSSSLERLVLFGYRYVTRSKGRFYLYLAVFCSILALLDVTTFHKIRGMKSYTFDIIMKNRISYRMADPDIVVVDIDEASLAAMAGEYGRWPWPRQVFAEFIENLETQNPQAVVFDILFSDPDVYNPDSDAYFNEVIGQTANTYFPMLRLNPKNDALSQVHPGMIAGMGRISGREPEEKGFAVVLPHFSSVIDSGRLGTNNIYPDADGIVRQYSVFREHHGWKIPSFPAKIGEKLNWKTPEGEDFILNWRGGLGAFTSVRFSEVYHDFLSREKKRPQDEFTDKIVIIGSTASALFDTKPTPMEKIHPGVEILATSLDNLKNGDWITPIQNPWIFFAASLILIWGAALGFLTGVNRSLIDGIFAGSQAGLIGVSFASLNWTTTFIDLTAPITAGFIYFSLARVYAYAETTLTERRVWLSKEDGAQGWQYSVVMVLELEDVKKSAETKIITRLKRKLNAAREGFTVEAFPDKPAGIGKAYGELVLIYYVESSVNRGEWRASGEGDQIAALVKESVNGLLTQSLEELRMGVCQGALPYGEEKAKIRAWRRLVTNAVQDL